MKYLIIVCLLLSACAKEGANKETAPVVTCDSLNAKYADRTESQLLAEAESADKAALTLADTEYFANLYLSQASELRKAADCK